MAALPTVGGSNNTWGTELNAWAVVNHTTAGFHIDGTAFGTNPASAGTIRLPNNGWVAGRNAANSADINAIRINSSNITEIGGRATLGVAVSPFDNNLPILGFRGDWNGTETSANRNVINLYSQARGGWSTGHFLYQVESRIVDNTAVNEKIVSGAANNGAGLIRITTSTAHGYTTGDRVIVDSVGGVPNSQGSWIVTTIDTTHVDLQGSTFAGAYTSGGITTNRAGYACFLALVAPSVSRGGNLTGVNLHADDVAGFFVSNNGTAKATDPFYVGHNTTVAATSPEWDTAGSIDARTYNGILVNNADDLVFRSSSYGTSAVPQIYIRRGRGTFDAPLRVKNADLLGRIGVGGALAASDVAAASFSTNASARIDFYANEDYTVSGQSARIVFYTTGIGTTTPTERLRIPNADGLDFTSGTFGSYAIRLGDAANANITFGTTNGNKIGTSTTEKIGFWNATPVVRPAAYTVTNLTTDRAFDANATTLDELADVLGTLITDLKTIGLIG